MERSKTEYYIKKLGKLEKTREVALAYQCLQVLDDGYKSIETIENEISQIEAIIEGVIKHGTVEGH